MSQSAIEHYTSEFDRLQPGYAAWLNPQRQSAIESLQQTGFPDLRQENWKYTNIGPITKRKFITTDANFNGLTPAQLDGVRFSEMDCHELVFDNGNYSASLSTLHKLPKGVIIQSLSEALTDNRTVIEPYLNRYAKSDKDGFVALNTAFLESGAFIFIPDNVYIEEPVHLLFLANKQPQAFVTHQRNLLVLGKNARATVIESYVGFDEAEYFTNTITEITLASSAVLEHYKLQQESQRGYHIGKLYAHHQRDSRVESHSFSLGGALVRNDIEIDLAEQGAGVSLNGLFIASGRQHIDNHTRVNHTKPHTSSEEYYHGVLDGSARGVFNGKVIVHKQAQKTDAHQSNKNLLLSDNAEVDTKPELEIYADDVKCSHGATVGQLDKTMLLYLRSRAIDEETAKSLLIFAFVEEIIKRIKFMPIRKRLEAIVVGKLPDANLIREFMQ